MVTARRCMTEIPNKDTLINTNTNQYTKMKADNELKGKGTINTQLMRESNRTQSLTNK